MARTETRGAPTTRQARYDPVSKKTVSAIGVPHFSRSVPHSCGTETITPLMPTRRVPGAVVGGAGAEVTGLAPDPSPPALTTATATTTAAVLSPATRAVMRRRRRAADPSRA